MKVNYLMDCCGVKEISGLSQWNTPQEALREVCKIIYPDPTENKVLVNKVKERAKKNGAHHCNVGYLGPQFQMHEAYVVYENPDQYSRFRFALFSEAHRPYQTEADGPKYGQNFAALIRESKLGELVETGRHENPNSTSLLKVWVWTVDHKALVEWYKNDAKGRHKKQPSVSLFAGGGDRWVGNQGLNGTGAVPTVERLGGSLPTNCEYTATCAPAPPRQG